MRSGLPLVVQILIVAWYTSPIWLLGLTAYLLRRENRQDDEQWHEFYAYLDEHDREASE